MGSAIGSIAGAIAGGGGGGSAPSANQGTQIKNAQSAYGTATSDAQQTMNTASAYNTNAQNTLTNVVGSETPEMQNVNSSANQNLSTYGSTFVPLQAQQAQQAQNWTSAANTQVREGQAIADQAGAASANLANQRAALESEGVDPASVRGAALDQQAGVQAAANEATAGTQSYLNTQSTGAALVNQANQLGTQINAAGNQGAAVGSQIGAQAVGDTNSTNATGINNLTAANTYLNTGVNANNSATSASSSQFNEGQQQYQDQQQSSANTGAMVGNIVGGIASFLEHGGPVTKRGALPRPIVPGTTDTKLIAATPGEFMLPKDVSEFMGHEKLHKLIDKTREQIAMRKGIPTAQLSSAHTAVGG